MAPAQVLAVSTRHQGASNPMPEEMAVFTTGTILKMALELALGICMKLFCDNGRVHWKDFVNDFLFWVPGVESSDSDGLSREVRAIPEIEHAVAGDVEATPLAAK